MVCRTSTEEKGSGKDVIIGTKALVKGCALWVLLSLSPDILSITHMVAVQHLFINFFQCCQ